MQMPARLLACAVLLALPLAAAAAELPPTGLPELIPQLMPEVVNISIIKHQPAHGATVAKVDAEAETPMADPSLVPTGMAYGTGYIVDSRGIIVTNRHVTDGADTIFVSFSDNTRLRAELIYRSPDIDMSLLRVTPAKPLSPVTFGDSDKMVQGDQVIAIGNPLALGGTVTTGIISALDRDIHETPYDSFLQIDAAINPGNSGGPLFNRAGQVIGMNTALYNVAGSNSGSIGLNFAIPSNDVKLVLDNLRQYGRIRRGYLGAGLQDVSPELAEAVGLPRDIGAIVASVDADGPAARAQLRPGDVIVKMADKPIDNLRGAIRFVAATPGSTNTPFEIMRDGASLTVPVSLAEAQMGAETVNMAMPPIPEMAITPQELGLNAATITDALRKQFDLKPDATGVVLTEVDQNGLGAYLGLEAGSQLLQVQDRKIDTVSDIMKTVDAARAAGRQRVAILVTDSHGTRWVAVPLGRGR